MYLFTCLEICHGLVHSSDAHSNWDWARLGSGAWDSVLGFPCGWQGPNCFRHHLLPPKVNIDRKLESEAELEL